MYTFPFVLLVMLLIVLAYFSLLCGAQRRSDDNAVRQRLRESIPVFTKRLADMRSSMETQGCNIVLLGVYCCMCLFF